MHSVVSTQKTKIEEIKVVLLGDSSVGKSSLLQRFIDNQFNEQIENTVVANFMTKSYSFGQKKVSYQIWDTAGQERYKSLTPLYYKDADVALIVYDLTEQKTFDELQKWFDELKELGPENIIMGIAANKSDLVDQYNMDITKIYSLAKKQNCSLYFTSAKTGSGVDEMFDKLG